MDTGSPPAKGFRGLLKRCARGVKKVFRPEAQASASRTPPRPQPQQQPYSGGPPTQPTSTTVHEQLPQPPVQSQQSASPPRPVSSAGAGASTSTPDLVAVDNSKPANAESAFAQAAKKAGADAWKGLETTLRLLDKGSDAFPPLKSAVAGFLGVVDLFEVSYLPYPTRLRTTLILS